MTFDVSSNAVEVHIHHLRRKLGSEFIRTVHGIGYTWVTHEIDATSQLRVRLTLGHLILVSITGNLQFCGTEKKTTDNVDELFDTVDICSPDGSTLDLSRINARSAWRIRQKKLKHGHIDDDALAFAIFFR